MLVWLQAHVAFNGGVYAGYSRTKRTVENFEKIFTLKEVGPKIQNQGVSIASLGISYFLYEFELGINGFIGFTLFKEKYFKNRLFGGGELSVLYHINKFTIGVLGGLDISSFKSHKYEYQNSNIKNKTDFWINKDASSQTFPRGFLGMKIAYSIKDNINIGIKYQYLFSKQKSFEENFKSENGISESYQSSDANIPFEITAKSKFSTHRILIGLELLKTKGI